MGNSSPHTSLRRQVISEACTWFVEFRTGDASAATRDRFDDWLRHSPEHIQAYLDRKSTRLNSSHLRTSRMPSSA